jgi:beta-galactosidase GanA
MKIFSFLMVITIFCSGNGQNNTIPWLQKSNKGTQLIVDGSPFIICGGELGNSSATTVAYMEPIWPKLKSMHLNSLLMPVYWELIEPQEGYFDFSLYKSLINKARENNIKIIFLWFGSWKNSMSSHVPSWVKLDQERFPRVKDDKNRSYEILTPFDNNNLQADLTAFRNFMQFIKDYDSKHHTVIMIQVENEIGMLPTARDYHSLANIAFNREVPVELIQYLQKNKDSLAPEFLEVWGKNGYKTSGNWEALFGKGLQTDEIFMAWFFSKYTQAIAEAGKKIYPLPFYLNTALNRPNAQPGNGYPSAGPLPHIIDIWKAGAPSIDFFAPDIYFSNFNHWCNLYVRQNNPLFIPEHRLDNSTAFKGIFSIGHYHSLGFSPFSIESADKVQEESLGKIYLIIEQLSPLIFPSIDKYKVDGVLFDKNYKDTLITFGKYDFLLHHDYTLGWSPEAKNDEWPFAGAIIIQTKENEFFIGGSGVVINFKVHENDTLNAGILKVDEGYFKDNQWIITRHLNGDQTHQGRHLRIPSGDYGIQRLELYMFK